MSNRKFSNQKSPCLLFVETISTFEILVMHAIPISACGLLLNDDAVRVAVGLRLGCTLCEQHNCRCGAVVDSLGMHAFSCKSSRGRIQRHSFINDLMCRALTLAGIPAMKEPHGLVRDDGKRRDGLTLLPWLSGRCATWDFSDSMLFAWRTPSHFDTF